MSTLQNTITIDIKSHDNGTYDTYIATEGSSGSHYDAINAKTIGEYTADLIDTLEEAASGKSYISDDNKPANGEMTDEYYNRLTKAGSVLCDYCEAEECESCMVSRLMDDAYTEAANAGIIEI